MRMRRVIWLIVAVLSIAPAVNAASSGLVLWLDYEGDLVDQSGLGNNGTAYEGWSGYGLPYYDTSLAGHGSAMVFGYGAGGATDSWNNVFVDKSDSIAHLGTMFSMGGWIRVDAVGGGGYYDYPKIFSCPNYEVTMHASGDPDSYFWPWAQEANPWGTPGSWDMSTADVDTYEGDWMHMIVTYDGTTFTQYIHGSPVFTATDFAHQFDDTIWDDELAYWTDLPLSIGAGMSAYPGGNGWLQGALDDTAIWGNAYLDADGVLALYNGTETPLTVGTLPEPATLLLVGLGCAFLRRKKA